MNEFNSTSKKSMVSSILSYFYNNKFIPRNIKLGKEITYNGNPSTITVNDRRFIYLTEGAEGVIYTDKKLVLKVQRLPESRFKLITINKLKQEQSIIEQIGSYYLIGSYHGLYISNEYSIQTMDYYRTTLYNLSQQFLLTERNALFYFLEVCKGIDYIHSKGYLHKDIKTENICISDDGHIKIIDFGLSNKSISGSDGTYRAPDILNGEYNSEYSEHKEYGFRKGTSNDFYAAGYMFYLLLFKEHIFTRNIDPITHECTDSEDSIIYFDTNLYPHLKDLTVNEELEEHKKLVHPLWNVTISKKLTAKTGGDKDLYNLLFSLLGYDYMKRPGYTDILNHPYVTQFNIDLNIPPYIFKDNAWILNSKQSY
jgi:serine/threonine protein kinase